MNDFHHRSANLDSSSKLPVPGSSHLWVATYLCAVILIAGCSKAELDGVVVGGSMYPSLRGERFEVCCGMCQFSYECDSTPTPKSGYFVCPNCGSRYNRVSDAKRLPAQSISISKAQRKLKRWDLVCIRNREDERFIVKRIVGLPGESVAIRQGVVHIDGKPAFPNDDFETELHVFDSNYLHPKQTRFHSESADWIPASTGWRFRRSELSGPIVWLNYQHLKGYRSFSGDQSRDIRDNYGFNQTTSRDLHRVWQLRYRCELELQNKQSAWLQIRNRALRITRENNSRLRWSLVERTNSNDDEDSFSEFRELNKGVVDHAEPIVNVELNRLRGGEVWFLGQQALADIEFDPDDFTTAPLFRVGTPDQQLRFIRLRIHRGIYYYDEANSEALQLSKNEYLVLGDNPPLSRDSRQFYPNAVRRSEIVGLVELSE